MTANAYVTVGSGISGQLMFIPEAEDGVGTWGVAPQSGTWRPLEFKSETLQLKKTTVQGQGLHGGGLFDRLSRRVLTNYDAGGTITFDLPNRNLNVLLRNMTGSPNSTITGTATPGNGSYVPAQLTPTGAGVSGTSGAYLSLHSPGSTGGVSMAIQKGVATADTPGSVVVEPFTYVGCKISDWEISVESGAIVQCALTIDARNELAGTGNGDPLNSAVPSLIAFTEAGVQGATSSTGTADPLSVFHFREATLTYGGTPSLSTKATVTNYLSISGGTTAANIKSASFKETHSLDSTRYFIGSNGFKAEQIENGFRQLTGSFVGEFLSAETYYNAFAADSTTALVLTFVGGTAGTSGTNADTIQITFPNIKLNGESPQMGGPGVVTENVTFTGLDDNLTAPYQILYISSDSGE